MARNLTPREKFITGRLKASTLMPYFTAAIMKMVPFELPHGSLKTFAVTPNGVMMYDPWCLEQWSVEEIADTFLHEVGHLLRGHADRCTALVQTKMASAGVDEKIFRRAWNIAADMELNDDLVEAGRCNEGDWRLPKEIEMKDGLTAEVYINKVLDEAKTQSHGSGEGEDEGDDFKACGSGAGCAVANEPEIKSETDEVGRSEAEIHQVKKQVAQAIQAAITKGGKGRGTVPAGWAVWADTVLQPPKIDWRTKLARAIRYGVENVRGLQDYAYTRPARRQGAYGWGSNSPIMPAMVAPVPRVAIAIDTSGSMGRSELEKAVSEASGVIAAAGAKVKFYACDAAVHSAVEVNSIDELTVQLKGGGGTSFKPVFKAIEEKVDKPHVLVFITDGGGDAPLHPPHGMHVIWVLVGAHRCIPHFGVYNWGEDPQKGEPWGEIIEIDDEDET